MSVLIKGMKMPKSCESCPCKTENAFGGLGCQATGYIPIRKVNQYRPDNCPLIELSPHGRLIDADRMQESIKRQAGFLKLMGGELSDIAEILEKGFLQEIANAPTIIPADTEEEEIK